MSLIVAIEQGKNKTDCVVFDLNQQSVVQRSQVTLNPVASDNGAYQEYDPDEIYESVVEAIVSCISRIEGLKEKDILSLGIAAQPGTAVAWDRLTGKPLANAISSDDARTNELVNTMIKKTPDCNSYHFYDQTGLPLNGFFSAFKYKWLLENVSGVRRAMIENRLAFGTIDSWIVFKLTLGSRFVTEVTSASKTMLMNIETFSYDPVLLNFFGISEKCLPEILKTAQEIGPITDERTRLRCVFINAIMCNSQAEIVGETFDINKKSEPMFKARVGSRGSFTWNLGPTLPRCSTGLLTSIIYKIDDDNFSYAVEGLAASSGSALEWMKNNLGLYETHDELEEVISKQYCKWKISGKDDIVYFVPAFVGCFSPYWRQDARSIIMGFEKSCNKNDILLAGMRACAYQMQDIIESSLECLNLNRPCLLMVSGGLSNSNTFLQSLADITGVQVSRSDNLDILPCLGVAIMCCISKEVDYMPLLNLRNLNGGECKLSGVTTFLPSISVDQRERIHKKWTGSVQRSFQWKPLKNFQDCKCKNEHKSRNCVTCSLPKALICGLTGSALGYLFMRRGMK